MIVLNEIISFIDSLLYKYEEELDPQDLALYYNELKRIKGKYNEDKLYLSVIGEFSAGKSSFINAILRDNLLDVHILQGTTTINNLIQYGEKLNVIVQTSDNGETKNLKDLGYDEEKIREQIKSMHKQNEYQGVNKAIISFPSAFLDRGVVIVDTPGINTPELWHEEVTKKAINELSDTSIILISATQPMPDSLVNFMKCFLKNVIHRCIFVVTKIDAIRQRERDEQLEYIRNLIRKKLDIESPIIIPYSSLIVLEETTDIEKTYFKNDRELILRQSYQSESDIFEYIKINKKTLLKENISNLLYELLDDIESNLNIKSQNYQERHNILKSNSKNDIYSFCDSDTCRNHLNNYINKMDEIIEKNTAHFNKMAEKDVEWIYRQLFNCKNENELKQCISSVNNFIFSKGKSCNNLLEKINMELINETNNFMEGFINLLNEEYSGLNALLPSDDSMNILYKKIVRTNFIGVDIVSLNTDINYKVGGGALIGGTIGTFALPGLGTILGSLIGGFCGYMIGPNMDKMKTQIWEDIYPKIIKQYENLKQLISGQIDKITAEIDERVSEKLTNYVEQYRMKINHLIELDKAEQVELKKRIELVTFDKKKIEEYKGVLNNV